MDSVTRFLDLKKRKKRSNCARMSARNPFETHEKLEPTKTCFIAFLFLKNPIKVVFYFFHFFLKKRRKICSKYGLPKENRNFQKEKY